MPGIRTIVAKKPLGASDLGLYSRHDSKSNERSHPRKMAETSVTLKDCRNEQLE